MENTVAVRREKIIVYDVLRVVAILLVVLGHSDFLYSHDFTVTGIIPDTLPAFQLDYLTVRPWIYSFHMPLFMILSGALFSFTYKKYAFKEYFRNRTLRLMVPYVVCGFLFSIPIKWIVGYFGSHSIFYAYARSLIAMISPGHLWFLWVTFVLNIVFFLLAKKGFLNSKIWGGGITLCICLVLNVISFKRIEWFQLYRLCEFPLYFYIGYLFEARNFRFCITKFWEMHNTAVKLGLLTGIFSLTIVLVAINNVLAMPKVIEHCYGVIQALIGSGFCFLACLWLSENRGIVNCKLYKQMKQETFSIYLYHEPLQFLMLWVLMEAGLLKYFNSDGMYVVLCLFRFVGTCRVSVLIGEMVTAAKKRMKLKF